MRGVTERRQLAGSLDTISESAPCLQYVVRLRRQSMAVELVKVANLQFVHALILIESTLSSDFRRSRFGATTSSALVVAHSPPPSRELTNSGRAARSAPERRASSYTPAIMASLITGRRFLAKAGPSTLARTSTLRRTMATAPGSAAPSLASIGLPQFPPGTTVESLQGQSAESILAEGEGTRSGVMRHFTGASGYGASPEGPG